MANVEWWRWSSPTSSSNVSLGVDARTLLDGRERKRKKDEPSLLLSPPPNGGDYTHCAIDDEEMKTRKMKQPRTEKEANNKKRRLKTKD